MHRAVLLYLAVLSGCASGPSGGQEYHRGTFTPPPPAPVRPGVGLPTYDPHVKPLPPQPQPKPGRLLPETPRTRREPGIWAATPWPDREEWPKVLDVRLPVPLDEREPLEGVFPGAQCAAKLRAAFDVLGLEKQIMSLHFMDRQCLIARLYKFCADTDLDAATRKAISGGRDDISKQRGQTADLAAAFKTEACRGLIKDATGPIQARVEDRWDTIDVLPEARKP